MKNKRVLLLVLLTTLLSFKSDKEAEFEITKVVLQYLDDPFNYGLSIGVISGDKEFIYCFGTADEKNGSKINPNSVFEIGSITKVFTAILLAAEVENKRMDLNESIFSYFPGIEKKTDISLLNLATHTSGFPRLADNFWSTVKDRSNPYMNYSDQDLRNYMSGYTLKSKPGTHYDYSNFGVGLLGSILSRQHKTSYEQLVQHTICQPWGLKSTFIYPDASQKKQLVSGHSAGRVVPGWYFQEATAGQGALRSSINDMLLFLKLNIFPEKCLSANVILLTQQEHFYERENGRKMGLGWHIGNFNKEKYLEHTGGTGGYRSFIGLTPESKTGIVILSNSNNDVSAIGIEILKILKSQSGKEL